jgi:hypothetical protein
MVPASWGASRRSNGERLLASWETLTREKDVPPVGVDLRYANGFAVEWPQPADEQEKPGRVGI